MNRFLMLVGVAVVAAAMYVAASSASQVSTGVSVAKFNALSKKVAALTKKVKTDEGDLNSLAFAYLHCSLPSEIAIYRNGGSSYGYEFQGGTGPPFFTTALDIAPGPSQANWELTPFNAGDTTCQSLVGSAPARHRTASVIAQTFGLKH